MPVVGLSAVSAEAFGEVVGAAEAVEHSVSAQGRHEDQGMEPVHQKMVILEAALFVPECRQKTAQEGDPAVDSLAGNCHWSLYFPAIPEVYLRSLKHQHLVLEMPVEAGATEATAESVVQKDFGLALPGGQRAYKKMAADKKEVGMLAAEALAEVLVAVLLAGYRRLPQHWPQHFPEAPVHPRLMPL